MNFDVAPVEAVTREFLAIILAGFGNELLPLTGDHGEESCPKALLPVSNKPMLEYALSWIEQSGIKDVLLICPSTHRPAISHYIHSQSSSASFSSLHIDLQIFDESQELSVGTCSVLKHFSARIQEDFVLLPCDFIPPPSLPLSNLLDKFRSDTTSDGSIATTCWFEPPRVEKGASPDEWGSTSLVTPIVWDDLSDTLLYVDTPDDIDRNGEELEIRMSLLSRHVFYPRAKLSSKLQDSHVYVCKRAVLDVLQQKTQVDSLREDFFPWLCKVQYQQTKRAKYGHVLGALANSVSHSISMRHSTLHSNNLIKVKAMSIVQPNSDASPLQQNRELGLSIPPSPTGSDDDQNTYTSLRIGVLIHRAESGFAVRANTLPSFLEANRHFIGQTPYTLPSDPQKRALIDQKASISADSIVGDFTRVEERASIKKSVIGKHCTIGKMAKIVGCVLMDHCVISDGAKLEGCILGKNTIVGAKADLVKCVTQGGYEIRENETLRNEKLDVSDWTADPDESEEEHEDTAEDASSAESSDE
ncbi:nucleotide-diphospho-sugar transferase [Hygrophoropsis aurantiaca]|uniref:Nucleotide-diphospho-sugar transferase n=1 Tax=Hygrophoropsis aurantiaca TaxID=72124 RepID=A0ACB8AKG6_9AGAM|nr:nucleotide-diphospho-sugar transferase [Hygrophoropsis aurantiaca]